MNASTTAISSASGTYNTPAFWERLWRTSGLGSLLLLVIAYFIYGNQPQFGATGDALAAFYGHRTSILIATFIGGMALLNLLWFAAALRATLADAGQEGWGAAATASSAVLGVSFFLALAMSSALAYAGAGNLVFTAGLNDFAWANVVLSSFPRAMFIMSGTFGLWRAGQISNSLFAAGVAVVVLTLLGATTWMGDGFWAPDGAYSRFISPLAGVAWLVAASWVLVTRSPATRGAW